MIKKISKMAWYREYPAGIESWKFLFPQSVVKVLLLDEKILTISLPKRKKLADLWSKSLAKFWCFNVNNKILLFISGCSHIWCESQCFDCILLVLFRWWSPDSKLVSLQTTVLQYSSSGVLLLACLQIPHLNKNCYMQLLCRGWHRKWRFFMTDYQNIFLLLYLIRKSWKNLARKRFAEKKWMI